MFEEKLADFKRLRSKFNKVVIWGLKTKAHTHRHIHKYFYKNLQKLGERKILWVDDSIQNNRLIESNDLVISVGFAGRFLTLRPDVFYCLHNFDDSLLDNLPKDRLVRLQVYVRSVEADPGILHWREAVFFDQEKRCLSQPWGTDLLETEFKKPVFSEKSRTSYFIGTVWNNELNQGNIAEINRLRSILDSHGIRLVCLSHIPDFLNIILTRQSRIAPAVGGAWQAQYEYLPCRMFKNISYGQLGLSNVNKFKDILKNYWIDADSMENMIARSLELKRADYIDLVRGQQSLIKEYTYLDSLINIMKAFFV